MIIVVFYYDFVLTMPQEIKHIWSSKSNTGMSLVITLRYFTAFGYIPVLMLAFAPVFASGERVSKSLYQIDSNFTTIPRFKFSVVGDKSLLWRGLLIVLYFSGPVSQNSRGSWSHLSRHYAGSVAHYLIFYGNGICVSSLPHLKCSSSYGSMQYSTRGSGFFSQQFLSVFSPLSYQV